MKTIALVDPYDTGHHVAFMQLFTKTLLDLGYKVLIFFPQNDKIAEWAAKNCQQTEERLITIPFQEWETESAAINKFNFTKAFINWVHTSKTIQRAEKKNNVKIDLVFFAWIDSYLARFLHPFLINTIFPYKWSGLYFHPWFLRLDPEGSKRKPSFNALDIALTSKNCINITVHDPGILSSFQNRLGGKKVVLFPETADVSAPDPDYQVAMDIKDKAQGRIVVGIVGLEKRKGTLTLIDLAKQATPADFFFVFAGNLKLDHYSPEEQLTIQNFVDSKPENCFFHLNPIPEGAKFNAVLCAFDIPFIVYNNFPSSSNILTKAANFKKLVLATERFCIGEDVKKYQLGITVAEGNVEQCLSGIAILKEKIKANSYPHSLAKEYARINGEQMLLTRFSEVLANLP